MNDTTGRVFMYYFGILVLFLLPVILFFVNMDVTIKSYVNDTISDFVDESRSTGCISMANYQKMVNDLCKTGTSYDIILLHQSYVAVPDNAKGYTPSYRVYNREDILNKMLSSSGAPKDYVMKDGDFLQIQVRSISDSPGTRVFGSLFKEGGTKILASDGGYVGNTKR